MRPKSQVCSGSATEAIPKLQVCSSFLKINGKHRELISLVVLGQKSIAFKIASVLWPQYDEETFKFMNTKWDVVDNRTNLEYSQ